MHRNQGFIKIINGKKTGKLTDELINKLTEEKTVAVGYENIISI